MIYIKQHNGIPGEIILYKVGHQPGELDEQDKVNSDKQQNNGQALNEPFAQAYRLGRESGEENKKTRWTANSV